MRRGTRAKRYAAAAAVVVTGAGLLSVGSTSQAKGTAAHTPRRGGSLTVLEVGTTSGHWPTGVGTTTNTTSGLEQSMMNAIYGQLIQIGPDGKTHPDLASGWTLSPDAKKLTVRIRKGVTFSDGTAFDAAAVLQNWRDDLAAEATVGAAAPAFPIRSLSAPDDHTVVMRLSAPDGAVVDQIQDTLFNWIASPTAEKREGLKQFALTPVGAGPFVVVSDALSSKLVLKRNPTYWEKGKPYLDRLTFEPAASDESALEAIQAGNAQAYENMGTPGLVGAYKGAGIQVTKNPGQSTSVAQINAGEAPFTSLAARQAVYYATDSHAIARKLYGGTCAVSQSFTGPGGLFYEPKVPGYHTYDLAKAKKLVEKMGGLSFTLVASGSGTQQSEAVALQAMYKAAGMNVTLKPVADITALIQEYVTGKWQVIVSGIGAWDPAAFVGGVAFRLQSDSRFTGVKDPKVDDLITQGVQAASEAGRAKAYSQLAKYVSDQAYAPFICSASSWNVAAKGVTGPGLTTSIPGGDAGPQVLWQDVSMSSS